MDDLEAFAAGYSASLQIDAAEGAPIESATVALNIYALDDACGVLQWADASIAALLDHGPAAAGFGATPTPSGTLWQLLAYRSVLPDLDNQMMYQTVAELKDAAVAAGLPCTAWVQDNLVEYAAGSGTCSESSVLSIFASEDDQMAAIANIRERAEGQGPVAVLLGANWLIVAPEVVHLAGKVGGVVVVYG